jgi:hypothetical protein
MMPQIDTKSPLFNLTPDEVDVLRQAAGIIEARRGMTVDNPAIYIHFFDAITYIMGYNGPKYQEDIEFVLKMREGFVRDATWSEVDTIYYSRWGVYRLEVDGQLLEEIVAPDGFDQDWTSFELVKKWVNDGWLPIGYDGEKRDWGTVYKRRGDPATENKKE